jgi:hypothetical protein
MEKCLGLTLLQWTAISTLATLLAVLVALFLPTYQEFKKNKQ